MSDPRVYLHPHRGSRGLGRGMAYPAEGVSCPLSVAVCTDTYERPAGCPVGAQSVKHDAVVLSVPAERECM